MTKTSDQFQLRDSQQNTLSVLLKTVKVVKTRKVGEAATDKSRLRRHDN